MNDRQWTTNEVVLLLDLPLPDLMQHLMAGYCERHYLHVEKACSERRSASKVPTEAYA